MNNQNMEGQEHSQKSRRYLQRTVRWGVGQARSGIDQALGFPIIRGARKSGDDFKWILIWLFWTILFCVLVSTVVWYVKKQDFLSFLTPDDMQSLEIFVSVFGLAYAIVVGLLIIEAHGRFHELSSTFRNELNTLSDIHDCLRYFHDDIPGNKEAKTRIGELLYKYVTQLHHLEWNFMRHSRKGRKSLERYYRYIQRQENGKGKNSKDYERYGIEEYHRISPFQCWDICEIIEEERNLRTKNEDDKCAQQKIVDKICDLTTLRTNRLQLAESGLKGYLRFFIIFMSLITVAGTMLLDLAQFEIQLFIVCATTAGVIGLFMVLDDVDRPFSGRWKIDEMLLTAIEDKLAE